MRTLESLVKKAGGWSKVIASIAHTDYTAMDKRLLESLIDNETLEPNVNERMLIKKMTKLNDIVVTAYIECKNSEKTGPAQNVWTPAKLPLCVVIAAMNNAITKCHPLKHITEEDFVGLVEDRINELKIGSNSGNLKNLMTRANLDNVDFFDWTHSPEGWAFWHDIFEAGNPQKHENIEQELKDINIYTFFIKAHPKYEKEIKEFCEQ